MINSGRRAEVRPGSVTRLSKSWRRGTGGEAELEAFEKRMKGRRKKNRRNTEVEAEESLWQKYRKYTMVPVCGVLLAMATFYMLQTS
ncbi:hypothetical protein Z043_100804 [Scleropages formosus]|uniref:Uncharacterized protein n=1 Tax=Scleropages formosus TaxID=113540 RepID=A0A0P7XRP6_SCLFO|nr:hypothetical protein Z043_100804 [Scleropages formosus]